jgi:hypothetical protein
MGQGFSLTPSFLRFLTGAATQHPNPTTFIDKEHLLTRLGLSVFLTFLWKMLKNN